MCELCGQTFRCRSRLQFHANTIHKGKFPYTCDKCGHGMHKKRALNSHICGRTRKRRNNYDFDTRKPQSSCSHKAGCEPKVTGQAAGHTSVTASLPCHRSPPVPHTHGPANVANAAMSELETLGPLPTTQPLMDSQLYASHVPVDYTDFFNEPPIYPHK